MTELTGIKWIHTLTGRPEFLCALVAGCFLTLFSPHLSGTSRLAQAQNGHAELDQPLGYTVRGLVRDADSGLPLSGANLLLTDSLGQAAAAASTGDDGRYALRVAAQGRFEVRVTFVGYAPLTDSLMIEAEVTEYDVRLRPASAFMDEVVIETVSRGDENFSAGLTRIDAQDLRRVPTPDVSFDLAGYLQTRPGVVTTGDRGGGLFVRGGTPTQNLILLDGIPVFQPFHIVGFFSAFPADNIAWVDVYAGGFPAQFGGRVSSVVDIATRNGDTSNYQASASIAPFLSGIRLEIPMAQERASLVVSLRESVIDIVSEDLLGEDLPFRFGDRFAKFHGNLNSTSSVSITMLQTFDEGNLDSSDNELSRRSTWKNDAYGARYRYIPPESAVMTEIMFYYSRLRSRFRVTPEDLRTSDIDDMSMKFDFVYLLGLSEVRFGMFGTANSFSFDTGLNNRANSGGMSSGGLFFQSRIGFSNAVRIEPGVRLEAFSRGQGTSISPRLRASWQVGGVGARHRFSAAWGMYKQQLVGLTREQDISDVFTTWAPSPNSDRVPGATHLILGWQGVASSWLEFSVETYRKWLRDIAWPVTTMELNSLPAASKVEGTAEGVDVGVSVRTSRFGVDVGYSLARVEYRRKAQFSRNFFPSGLSETIRVSAATFNPPHDRRHQVNATGRYETGNWAVSARWQFGTGLPFTPLNGFYTRVPITNPQSETHLGEAGRTFISQAQPFSRRQPTYHRLDLTAEHVIQTEEVDITLQGGIINVYDRENLFEYSIFSGSRIDQLPLIPTFGVRIDLR